MTYIDQTESIPDAPNFTWRELTVTNNRRLIRKNRRVPTAFSEAGTALAQMAQVIRGHYTRPLMVHSGYRCPELNAAIHGSTTSQHMRFEAIDFHVHRVPLAKCFDWIRDESGMKWGQLILEGWSPEDGDASWIHMSLGYPYRAAELSQQVLYYSARENEYTRIQ